MKSRDSKGRFSKPIDEGLAIPSIKSILYWITLGFIFLPWMIILSKFNLFERISLIFDSVFKETENAEQNKKNGLFY